MVEMLAQGAGQAVGGQGHEAAQHARGQGQRQPGARGLLHPGQVRDLEEHGQGYLARGRNRRDQVALFVVAHRAEVRELAAEVHDRGDVLAAMDAVPGRAHDFGHIGPDAVEAGALEGAAVARAADRDLAGGGLLQRGAHHRGREGLVTLLEEGRVLDHAQGVARAVEDAGEAGPAAREVRVRHEAQVFLLAGMTFVGAG